jgi:hypothetical protein
VRRSQSVHRALVGNFLKKGIFMSQQTSSPLSRLMQAGLSGETDRRSLLKMAGAAAASAGFAASFPFGLKASAQVDDNIFIYGSG